MNHNFKSYYDFLLESLIVQCHKCKKKIKHQCEFSFNNNINKQLHDLCVEEFIKEYPECEGCENQMSHINNPR